MATAAGSATPADGFRLLVGAVWISNVGDGVRNAALPLLAVSLAGDASGVGVVAAAGTVPFALFGLVAGTHADRRARRPLIIRAHLFRAVVIAAMAVLIWRDSITLALVAAGAFLLGCGEAIADSATPALVPELVADHMLESANASLETAELVANDLVGPPVGSVLFSLGASIPFAVDALSFLGAAGVVARLDHDEAIADDVRATPWRADLTEGMRVAWTNRVLRSTGLLVMLLQVGHLAALAPFVVYLTTELGLEARVYGAFLAIGAIGGIAGARVAPRVIDRFGNHRTMTGVLMVSIASFALLAIPTVATAAMGFTASFGAVIIGRIIIFSARQRSVPGRLMGRAQGAVRSMVWGAATAGALLGGVLYDNIDPSAPYLFAAAVYTVALVAVLRPMRGIFDPSDR